jgi:hypothetical protein
VSLSAQLAYVTAQLRDTEVMRISAQTSAAAADASARELTGKESDALRAQMASAREEVKAMRVCLRACVRTGKHLTVYVQAELAQSVGREAAAGDKVRILDGELAKMRMHAASLGMRSHCLCVVGENKFALTWVHRERSG